MADNGITGDTKLRLGDGSELTIRYDLRALAELATTLGPEYRDQMVDWVQGMDVEKIAAMLAIGLRRGHPDLATAERVMDLDAAWGDTVGAVMTAFKRALWGDRELPAEADGEDDGPLSGKATPNS